MTNNGNEPNLTLSDLYDKDVVYTSRPSYISNPWLKPDEHQSNFLTGRELLIANQLPVIVHEASATDKLHQLFQVIGKDVPNSIYTFNNQQSYENLIKQLAHKENKKIYFQYIHDETILNQQYYALDKTLFVALNNKARIPEWTNGKFLPKRKVVKIEQFENEIKNWEFPFVIKPGDDLPTAGGYGVMICYHDTDLQKAITRIKDATAETNSLIIEQKIEEKANYCVQFAYSESLGIQYLGAATQLTDKYGFYNGNENTTNVPEHVIEAGRQIMENGVNQGFFGVAGFDLLVDEDDNVYAIDLNFRQNGSTSMLLLANELNSGYQKFYSYHSKGDNTHFFNTILKYVKEGCLYPLSYYDGDRYGEDKVKSRFGCIWHGDSKETVLENECAFLAELERC
ncbi:ATP-grasp domain-containing protein [Staphylococcus aureus]|uniref:L-aspartate--L-methionine ligase LdmS n=1 Tax=Staphylococcus aureus TaxID=1280 RepID=UPI003F7B34EC